MTRKICLMIIVLTGFIRQSLFAQPDTLWTRLYGGSENEIGYCVQQTTDGGFILLGTTKSYGAGNYDFWLIRTDASGDTLWTKTYGGSENDGCSWVEQTNDGGFILTGSTLSIGAGSNDVWVIKTDASGDTLWTRTYGGIEYDDGQVIQQLSDNGYIIIGNTKSYGAGSLDIWLIRADASGDTLWTRAFGGSNNDIGYSMQTTTDNGFILAGRTASFGTDGYDSWLVKTDASGDTLWTRTYGGTEADQLLDVQQTADGGYIVTGHTMSCGEGLEDLWLAKTNASGDTLWTKTFGGSEADRGDCVRQTTDGGYIVTGYTQSFGAGSDDLWIIKTDASGDTLWTKTFGGSEVERGHCIQQISDGEYIIAGHTFSFGHGESDVWLIRLGLEESTTVTENRFDVPESYRLFQNYPNPFNPETTIHFKLPVESIVELKIYNILGIKVRTLLEEKRTAGYYTVYWNGRNDSGALVPSGVYMYEFVTSDFKQMKKMLLLK